MRDRAAALLRARIVVCAPDQDAAAGARIAHGSRRGARLARLLTYRTPYHPACLPSQVRGRETPVRSRSRSRRCRRPKAVPCSRRGHQRPWIAEEEQNRPPPALCGALRVRAPQTREGLREPLPTARDRRSEEPLEARRIFDRSIEQLERGAHEREGRSPLHGDSPRGIETATALVFESGSQRRRQRVCWNLLETEPRVEGHVPGNIAEGGQCHRWIAMLLGPRARGRYQLPPEPATSVLGANVDLLEVCGVGLQHLDMSEAHGRITGEGDPETPLALGSSKLVLGRDLLQNRFGGMALEKLGGCELYGRDDVQIARSSGDDPIGRQREIHRPPTQDRASSGPCNIAVMVSMHSRRWPFARSGGASPHCHPSFRRPVTLPAERPYPS
jgi:hypothetical protein